MKHSKAIAGLLSCFSLIPAISCADQTVPYVKSVDADGNGIWLADDRQPALYTGNFGDCLGGGSRIQLSEFRAAYYKDNSTILFQFAGNNTLYNTSLVLSIDVYAYGQNRFHNLFDPCGANIRSLCPANSSTPIWAEYIIPVGAKDVAAIPDIALAIPDFEGQAVLRLFSNATQTEVGCFAATMTNGNSMSQPATVGTFLGLFTAVAIIASFATTIYGRSISELRSHYAHSLSVGVVFAVFQHIFLTGALSVNWPSILPAFWSNFAWSAGMIHTDSMQNSIDNAINGKVGNVSTVGAAGTNSSLPFLGGGYNLNTIYYSKRDVFEALTESKSIKAYSRSVGDLLETRSFPQLSLRDAVNATTNSTSSASTTSAVAASTIVPMTWSGTPVAAGMPIPGNFSGFAGALAPEHIRASNAFLTALLWLVILLVLLAGVIVLLKWTMELMIKLKAIRHDRLVMFRTRWIEYLVITTLRFAFLAFPVMMFFSMWDFSYQQAAVSKAIAAIVFVMLLVFVSLSVGYAYWYRSRSVARQASTETSSSTSQMEKNISGSLDRTTESLQNLISRPLHNKLSNNPLMAFFIKMADQGRSPSSIHDDEDYTRKFGWLFSRFRRSRWWFFGALTVYEFIKACVLGGASQSPLAQIFILVLVEIMAFGMLVWARPFEGRRLNILVTYFLGISKIFCPALSLAFYGPFNLPRILTTAIGIIIILIQLALTIITVLAIVAGAVTSWMSVRRHVATEDFKPKKWRNRREKYFAHLERAAEELPPLPKVKPAPPPRSPPMPSQPYFSVAGIRRVQKIEDDDKEALVGISIDPAASIAPSRTVSPVGGAPQLSSSILDKALRSERTSSIGSSIMTQSNLPFGAKQIRPSWSVHNFHDTDKQSINLTELYTHPSSSDSGPTTPTTLPLPSPLSAVHHPLTPASDSSPLAPAAIRSVRSTDTIRSQPASMISPSSAVSDIPMPRIRPRESATSLRAAAAPSRCVSPLGWSGQHTATTDASGLISPGLSINGVVASPSEVGGFFPRSASPLGANNSGGNGGGSRSSSADGGRAGGPARPAAVVMATKGAGLAPPPAAAQPERLSQIGMAQ